MSPPTADDALAAVSAAAGDRAQYENFPVALRILPARVRTELGAVYRYARFVDDVGDGERGAPTPAADRLAALDRIAAQVARLPDDAVDEPAVAALAGLVGRRPEARPALVGLIDANRMDQSVSRYETFDALLDYCALSAAPVGRLVLEIAGVDSESARRASDDVCNALQVLEHCQDVGEDGRNGRIYLPLADLRAAGVPESAVLAAQTSPALRGVVALQVRRARGLLGSGDQLLAELRGWARVAVAGYVAGGYATAVALERGDYGVLEHVLRPSRRRTATTALRLLARTARR